jgi:hypothetical protein
MQVRSILVALFCLITISANAATTLLPPGMQCFTDATGAVISGSVNMFYPNTTTVKPTWQDGNQSALNSQPIQLDGNGCATIYGIGAYRQQLYDGPVVGGNTTGNLLFDKITTDTSAYNAVFWAGLSAGTANVITVVDTGFNGTDGTVINFTALATNTGSTTINPSGFGAINVVKSTTAGPVSLVGGEIVQSNPISVVYSASANTFTILNPPIVSASGNIAPLCGASNLNIVNGSSPNSIIAITADQAVMLSSGGLVISRNTISLAALNLTTGTSTSTANGMDGEAVGTSAWIYIWLIDNGSATAALASAASGNGLSPTLPSGYIYKCRIGVMRVDGSGNLLRTLQLGNTAQYTIITPSNTAAMPSMISGISGSTSTPTWTAVSVSPYVPPTASSIVLSLFGANTVVMAAPNNKYGPVNSATNPPPVAINTAAQNTTPAIFALESTNVYYAATNSGSALYCLGWKDHINAN